MNQMSTVEHTKTITSTQTVNNPTTVSTYPTPSSSLNEASHPLISSNVYNTECPACAPSTVTTTVYQQQPPIVLSNMTPSCPVCRSSTVTTTISPVVLSAAVQIGILATSAGLICLPILALVIVAYCWVRTHRAVKKKRRDSGMNIDPSAKDR